MPQYFIFTLILNFKQSYMQTEASCYLEDCKIRYNAYINLYL